ncbi:MAG: molecular chaperone DnaJ [Gammaproteobacteria bacterium]|nr:molecular chaperone DnaJ [Gammaproteobacteria bacterium]
MAKRDYYEVLGVSRSADNDELKRAFRRLAMKYHPDRNPDQPDAEERFKEATEAFEILSDQEKRSAYDRFGHQGIEGMASGGFSNFANGSSLDDIFSNLEHVFGDMFMGSTRGRTRSQQQRGSDLSYELTIDLEQAVSGDKMEVRIPALRTCNECDGSGAERGTSATNCPDCDGTGRISIRQQMFFMQQTCPRCRGAGKTIQNPCRSCQGQGRVSREKTLSVTVPPGVDRGTRLRVSGEGESGVRGGPPGDLYIVFDVRPHPVFERQNQNLMCEVPVTFTQAALGSEIDIPTLEGSVKLRIPAETQTGKLFRLRGRGAPSLRDRGKGDLLCKVVVETPINLSSKQRDLLEELETTLEGTDSKHTPHGKSFGAKVRDFIDSLTSN